MSFRVLFAAFLLHYSSFVFADSDSQAINFSAFTLHDANRPSEIINNIPFPRWNAPLWRGVSRCGYHYKPEKYLASLLGLNDYIIPSKLFTEALNQNKSLPETVKHLKRLFYEF